MSEDSWIDRASRGDGDLFRRMAKALEDAERASAQREAYQRHRSAASDRIRECFGHGPIHIHHGRGGGKTSELICMAHAIDQLGGVAYIACLDRTAARHTSGLARDLNIAIREPITIDDILKRRIGGHTTHILVDDIDAWIGRRVTERGISMLAFSTNRGGQPQRNPLPIRVTINDVEVNAAAHVYLTGDELPERVMKATPLIDGETRTATAHLFEIELEQDPDTRFVIPADLVAYVTTGPDHASHEYVNFGLTMSAATAATLSGFIHGTINALGAHL